MDIKNTIFKYKQSRYEKIMSGYVYGNIFFRPKFKMMNALG